MNITYDIARIILGLTFFLFGLNGFFNWWPLPKMKPAMMKFNEDLLATQIIMPVVKIYEVIFGFMLLIDHFSFFATLAVLPICFFISLAHIYFNRPKGLITAGVFIILTGILVGHHWQKFLEIIQ